MPRRPTERRDFGFIRRLPSGRYQASFVGPDLRRHNGPVTFESRDLAVMWLAGEKKKVDAAIADDADWVSPTEQKAKARRVARRETLATYGRRWIGERRSSRGEPLRVLTRKDYEQVLATYINPTFGRMHVDEITRSDVRQWHAGLADAGLRSRTKAYGLLRAIMNSAVDDELITISPVHIRGAGAATKRRALEPATPAGLGVIAANMPERLRAAVMISAWCALRYGELAELRRKDIDAEQKLIKVRRAVTFPPGGAVVGPTKSEAGVRDVSIPPHVWPIIAEPRSAPRPPNSRLGSGTRPRSRPSSTSAQARIATASSPSGSRASLRASTDCRPVLPLLYRS